MQLALMSWPDIEAYLKKSTGIVVPVGSTEQHGLNGLIGTDHLCAAAVAEKMGEAGDILVAPVISIGCAQFNLGYPGTISARATTLMALASDYVTSLARAGFSHVYFLNGHGGNISPLRAAFQDIYADNVKAGGGEDIVRCRLRSWWEYPGADALRKELYGDWEGLHVTPSEVAITMAAHPGKVGQREEPDPAAITPEFIRDHGGDNHWDAESHKQAFPDGRIGSNPSLAAPEDGRKLLELAAQGAIDDFHAFLAEE